MEDSVKSAPDSLNSLDEQVEMIEPRNMIEPPIYSKLELLKNHNVTFRFLDLGCTISVGCKTYAFSDVNVALEEFSSYVKNPSEARKKFKELTKLN